MGTKEEIQELGREAFYGGRVEEFTDGTSSAGPLEKP